MTAQQVAQAVLDGALRTQTDLLSTLADVREAVAATPADDLRRISYQGADTGWEFSSSGLTYYPRED